jgi:predicted nuclease with TOPRIM domain
MEYDLQVLKARDDVRADLLDKNIEEVRFLKERVARQDDLIETLTGELDEANGRLDEVTERLQRLEGFDEQVELTSKFVHVLDKRIKKCEYNIEYCVLISEFSG